MVPTAAPTSGAVDPALSSVDAVRKQIPDPVERVAHWTRWGRDTSGGAGTLPPDIAAARDLDIILARAAVDSFAELARRIALAGARLSRGRVSRLHSRAVERCRA
jgi:hypothetical protein